MVTLLGTADEDVAMSRRERKRNCEWCSYSKDQHEPECPNRGRINRCVQITAFGPKAGLHPEPRAHLGASLAVTPEERKRRKSERQALWRARKYDTSVPRPPREKKGHPLPQSVLYDPDRP